MIQLSGTQLYKNMLYERIKYERSGVQQKSQNIVCIWYT